MTAYVPRTIDIAVDARALKGLYKRVGMSGRELAAAVGVDPSAIYPTLKALEAEGLIESELVDEGAGPARKVFHITAEGRKALDEFVERHIRLMAADVEYFLHRYDAIRAGHKSDKARAGKAPAHHAMHGKAKK